MSSLTAAVPVTAIPTNDPSTDSITGPTFRTLGVSEPILRALGDEGYEQPTPIQVKAIPPCLQSRDLLGCAQTGTGKTAAFAIPCLQALAANRRPAPQRGARVLVLTPTRELAIQVNESFQTYGRYLRPTRATVFGGVGQQPQVDALMRGVDVLVATPGRLLDLIQQRHAKLDRIEILVLDEADRMLDMGFLPDVRRILSTLPSQKQTLLFSATMPPEILDLARGLLHDPVEVAAAPSATTAEGVRQQVMFVERGHKKSLLVELLKDPTLSRALVFTRTKHGANRLVRQLEDAVPGVEAIHGNKSQSARQAALARFKSGRCRVLVATDIAARGIDVEGISHVINYELPQDAESYVHRIGRTARAGAQGIAITFCDAEERAQLRDIERLTRQHVPVVEEHPFRSDVPMGTYVPSRPRGNGGSFRPNRSGEAPRFARRAPSGGGSRTGGNNRGGSGGAPGRWPRHGR